MSKKLTRRDFMKTVGTTSLAVAATSMLAGCSTNGTIVVPGDEEAKESYDEINAKTTWGEGATATFGYYDSTLTVNTTTYGVLTEGADEGNYDKIYALVQVTMASGFSRYTAGEYVNYFLNSADTRVDTGNVDMSVKIGTVDASKYGVRENVLPEDIQTAIDSAEAAFAGVSDYLNPETAFVPEVTYDRVGESIFYVYDLTNNPNGKTINLTYLDGAHMTAAAKFSIDASKVDKEIYG